MLHSSQEKLVFENLCSTLLGFSLAGGYSLCEYAFRLQSGEESNLAVKQNILWLRVGALFIFLD